MCTFAWAVGVARDQNHNFFFSVRGGKKVAYHWSGIYRKCVTNTQHIWVPLMCFQELLTYCFK